MPSRKSTKAAEAAAARLPSIPKGLIDQFVSGPMSAQAVQDISMAFKKALIERALSAELSRHLAYSPGDARLQEGANHRNGSTGKTVLTDDGPNFICSVTDAVMSEVGAWQARPLEPMYPVVFFDALRVKVREDAVVRNKAIASLHSQLRKIIKTRGHFPSDDAATKLIWLALRNIVSKRARSMREW